MIISLNKDFRFLYGKAINILNYGSINFLLIIGTGLFFYARKESKKVLKYVGVGLITLSIVLIIVKQLGWISTDNGSSVETQLSSYNDIIETVSC